MANTKRISKSKEAAVETQAAALNAMREQVKSEYDDIMGTLHNQIQAYLAQSQLPLPCIIAVLQMLMTEAMEIAFQKYFGEK